MSTMSIGEVAARTGIPASTLRYYEELGLLPQRVSGQRRYDDDTLRLLAEIRDLLGASPLPDRWRAPAQQKMAEADAMIERAHQIKQTLSAGMDCDCTDLEDCDLVVGF